MAQETREERLERTLKTLHGSVEGIKATVVVNIDGLLVAAFPPGDEENPHENPTSSPQVAAMSATLIGLAERTLGRLAQELESNNAETRKSALDSVCRLCGGKERAIGWATGALILTGGAISIWAAYRAPSAQPLEFEPAKVRGSN